jgi:hypothetical protein
MTDTLTPQEQRAIRQAAARASEQGWGLAVGLLAGLGLFIATLVLVVKGGPAPGQHLGMLRAYFPGYSVTWIGGIVGFIYAFVMGYAVGRTIATVYNKFS